MNIEDIKVGEKYNLELLARGIERDAFSNVVCATFELPTGRLIDIRPGDFEALSPANGIKNTETAPKYDPCREFQEGDRVRMIMRDGRYPKSHGKCRELIVPTDNICTVIRNEYDGLVQVKYENGYNPVVPFCFLELVTPVEELYYVEDVGTAWVVRKPEPSDMYSTQAWFSKERHPHAKAAAEAECKRLNEEQRKELK